MRTRIVEGDGDPRHGTTNGYVNLRCRCPDCTLANREQVTRWRATSPTYRRQRATKRAEADARKAERDAQRPDYVWTPPRDPAPCGTRAAFIRHKRAGETPDRACVEAQRKYDREQKRNKRTNNDGGSR